MPDSTAEILEKERPKEGELISVKRIHLLVHPGFLLDTAHEIDPYIDKLKYAQLLDKYKDSAEKMGEDEIMVAFLHTSPDQFKRDLKENKQYATFIRKLKAILGNKFFVVSGDFEIFHEENDIEKLLQIIKGRGFNLSDEVESVAYGETAGACVEEGANTFNRTAKLKKRTAILLGLTDLSLDDEKIRKAVKTALSQKIIPGSRLELVDPDGIEPSTPP